MDDQMYRKLQLIWNLDPTPFFEIHQVFSTQLNKYESKRRLTTLANQIIQKTAVENWKLIFNSLSEKGKRKSSSVVFLNSLQKDFQLDHEFPDILAFFELWKEDEGIMGKKSKNFKYPSGKFIYELVGFAEYVRRFEFEITYLNSLHMFSSFKPQTDLPKKILEDLKRAERSNGVHIWTVCCFIEFLGLEKKKNFKEYEYEELKDDFNGILGLMESDKYFYVPWHESPDRAWLTRNYKEYHQKLNSLCKEKQERKNNTNKFNNLKLITGQTKYFPMTIETKLLFLDQGIHEDACVVIHNLVSALFVMGGNSQEDLNYRELSISIDWSSAYKSIPWKFDNSQKKVIQNWFQFKK
jgi:hypothetical protein